MARTLLIQARHGRHARVGVALDRGRIMGVCIDSVPPVARGLGRRAVVAGRGVRTHTPDLREARRGAAARVASSPHLDDVVHLLRGQEPPPMALMPHLSSRRSA